jgi:hypothetical protein
MKLKQRMLKKKINLTHFSAHDDIECLSEDGLWALAAQVCTTAHLGWMFVDCYRDDKKPGIVHLVFEKQANDG